MSTASSARAEPSIDSEFSAATASVNFNVANNFAKRLMFNAPSMQLKRAPITLWGVGFRRVVFRYYINEMKRLAALDQALAAAGPAREIIRLLLSRLPPICVAFHVEALVHAGGPEFRRRMLSTRNGAAT